MIINKKRLKNLQAFKEKGKDDYLIVDFSLPLGNGKFESICSSIESNPNTLCVSCVGLAYIEKKCYPISWNKIPQNWQNQFLQKLDIDSSLSCSKQMRLF